MKTITPTLQFFLQMAKITSVMNRQFDARLGGIGANDFMILLNLSQNPEQKMRRIDLADKIGLTASGVTRLLLPMEKIGLVSREINEHDARVSYVVLAPGGKMKLEEAMERAEMVCEEMISPDKTQKIEEILGFFAELSRSKSI